MKLDIPYYIRQVLREQRSAYVPGIGTFTILHVPASFNDDKTILFPPNLKLLFDESDSEDTSLVQYIVDEGKYNVAKINKRLQEFATSGFNKLVNLHEFEISGIGKLTRDIDDDKVSFQPYLEDLTREFKDLKAYPMKPLGRFLENERKEKIAIVPTKATKSGVLSNQILKWIIIGVLLALLWILGYNIYKNYILNQNEELGDNIDLPNEYLPQDSTETKKEELSGQEDEISQKYKEVDEIIDSGSQRIFEDNEASRVVQEKIVENLSPSSDGSKKGQKQNLDPSFMDEMGETDDFSKEQGGGVMGVIPESGKCIIIVGSFKKASNVTRMVSLLEREGYDVYTSVFKDKTRVGFTYSCETVTLESYLQDIRKKISAKAWYLDPPMVVPYVNG